MKKQILLLTRMIITVVFVFLPQLIFAQISISITPPASNPGACKQNLYRLRIQNSGLMDTVTIVGGFSPTGSPGCITTSQQVDFNVGLPAPTSGITILSDGDSLVFTIADSTIDTLYYNAYIDCHIIQADTSSSVSFVQSFLVNNTIISTHSSPNLRYPYLIELNANQNMNAYYLTSKPFVYMYQSTRPDTAHIKFYFTHDTSEYCHQITTDSIKYQKGLNGSALIYAAGSSIALNQFDTLIIKQFVTLDTCFTSCSKDTAVFRYTCDYPTPVSSVFCSSCQKEYKHPYDINKDLNPSVDILRIAPTDAIYDFSCMNDATGTTWSYKIINNGNEAIDSLKFNLTQNTSLNTNLPIGLRFLSLVPISSVQITRNGSFLNMDTLIIRRADWLCKSLVPDALHNMKVTVKDFLKTDTIYVSFKTIRCSSSDTALFNVDKNYNQWGFDSLRVKTICGVTRYITTTSGLMSGTTYISGQSVPVDYDVNLKLTFLPTVSDLTYAGGVGESTQMHMDMKSVLNNNKTYVYQLLGCDDSTQNCDSLFGWLRARVITKTNLILFHPSKDGFLRKINPITGDTVLKAANYWHSTLDTMSCMDRQYDYYFKLQDSVMRNYLDSGQFVFNLTACCQTDDNPTPYFVEFYLLAKPKLSCFNTIIPNRYDTALVISDPLQEWLSLSVKDNNIAVHCPGCKAPGIIVDDYRMNRKSLGLQDTDNDGRADSSTATIDTSSVWYHQNKHKLNVDYSTFNDRVEDYTRAHLQAGDPTTGGYSYVQMQDTLFNLRFNALQLSRRIPLGLETMQLIPDTLFLYVDSPVDSINGCYECGPYGMGQNDFTTQLKLVVSGSDIFTYFLDTMINNNEYLFSFLDTAGGNMHLSSFIDPVIGSSKFNGFFEGQFYRMRVSYRVCGNFSGDGFDMETHVRESKILNKMWLSGKAQTTSSIPQMLNDTIALHDSLLTINPADTAYGYALMDTAYVNNYLFFCETRGTIHYFVSSDCMNESTVTNDVGCEKSMTVISTTKIAGGKLMFDAYPYEYRPPVPGADSVFIQVPAGYYISRAAIKNRVLIGGVEFTTDTTNISLSDSTGSVILDMSDFPSLQCLSQADTPSTATKTMFVGDQLNRRIIDMKLQPIVCPPASIKPADSTIIIGYDRQNFSCIVGNGCNLPDTLHIKQTGTANQELKINADLSISSTSSTVQAKKDTICWNLTISNSTLDGITSADNVFIAIVPGIIQSYLSGWHFYADTATIPLFLNDTVVPICASLGKGVSLSGKLCAVVDQCPPPNDTIDFDIHYGWNCGSLPLSPYDSSNVCDHDVYHLEMIPAGYELDSHLGKVYETPYTLCAPFELTTCFQNNDEGYLYPYEIVLSNIEPGLNITGGMMYNSAASAQLTPTGSPAIWILDADSIGLLYTGGGFALGDPELCITFNIIVDCAYAGDTILPDKNLFARSFCGDTVNFNATYTHSPQFVWNDSTICDDCYTLDKFVLSTDTVAYTSIPFTYYVAACNLNADSNIVSIGEHLPLGFTASTPLPIITTLHYMECDTFAITGIFSSADSCPHSMNTAMLIHSGDTLQTDSVCVPVISSTALCIAQANPVWTGPIYSSTLPNSNSGLTIYISDSLYVNDSLSFINCHVIMGPGASITIVSGGYMHVDRTTIEGCFSMWRGISDNGQVLKVTENSIIRDANIAVLAKNKSTVTIIDSKLFDNAKNVVIPTTTGVTTMSVSLTMHGDSIAMVSNTFKPTYSGQPAHAFRPLVGVEAHHWVGTIGDDAEDKNVFHNLITGIYAERSLIDVHHNDFRNMYKDTTGLFSTTLHGVGVAIFSTGAQTPSSVTINSSNYFYNCLNGTYTNKCATNIDGVAMDSVRTGIHIRNGVGTYSVVHKCIINAYSYGVDLYLNAGATGVDIINNTIAINRNASGTAGISMEEITHNNPFYIISENNITITGARDGIVAANVFNPVIIKNEIAQLIPSSSPNANRGISLYACDSAMVSCNTVSSTYNTGSAHAIGIKVNLSTQTTVSCNSVFDQYYGISFYGLCSNTSLVANAMNRHYVGLYLDKHAAIGLQPVLTSLLYNGNTWLDTTNYLSGYGAVNLNDSTILNLQASLFTTNSTISAHNPKIPLNPGSAPFTGVDDNGWFDPQASGYSISCSDSGICESFLLDGGDEEMRMMIARDSTLTSGFVPESKMMAKQQLYDELTDDPTLTASDTVYQNFVDNQQITSIGYLHETELAFESSTVVDNSLLPSMETADSLRKEITLDIFQLDSLIVANPLVNYNAQRDDLIDNFTIQQEDLQNSIIQQKSIDSLFIVEAETKNALVIPTELPDENEKFINSVMVVYVQEGVTGISAWYSQILAIANQCPFEGGTAVYLARILVRDLGYTTDYDDDYTCLQAGYYRQSQVSQTKSISLGFTIVPNPANENADVILNQIFEGSCTLIIGDPTGRIVYSTNFNGHDKRIRIPTSSLSSGMYQVKIDCNNLNSEIHKLSIVR